MMLSKRNITPVIVKHRNRFEGIRKESILRELFKNQDVTPLFHPDLESPLQADRIA